MRPDATAMQRYEPWLLLLVPMVYALSVFSPDITFDPDAYYHIGCARLYATQGWLSSFPWLKFTVLSESFANVHLGQHLLLAPLTILFEPLVALKAGVLLLSSLLALSLYAVLKRWDVPRPALWAVLGSFGSVLSVNIGSTIKGSSLFFVLLVWFIDAVWSGSARRSFVLAWLSVYVYVGAPILLPLLGVHLVISRIWDGRWHWRLAAAVVGGLLTGYVLNPFWPAQWVHTARELGTVFHTPKDIVIGEFFGTEWISVSGSLLLELTYPFLALWGLLLVRQLGRSAPVSAGAAAGVVSALGLLGASIVSAKFFPLFYVLSLLFIPRLVAETRPWRWNWPSRALILAGCLIALSSLNESWSDVHGFLRRADPAEYQRLGAQLQELTPANEVIVAPWDDFPGIFLFDPQNVYVAGMNPLFLRWASEKRFKAFSYLYQGKVRDPENLLPQFFGDARTILVRSKPRRTGELKLLQGLANNPHFEEIRATAPTWRIYRLKKTEEKGPQK